MVRSSKSGVSPPAEKPHWSRMPAMRTAALLLCVALPTLAAAQTPPSRDTSATAKKGTGIIQGKVVAADGARPLRRARVSLATVGGGAEGRRTVSTGLDGSYTFKELPAGRFRITVTRGGYLQLEYGQRRPGEPGRPLQLGEGEKLEKVDFTLPRMSGIVGRVTDENGEPIEGVSVYAMRSLFYDGRRRLVPVSELRVTTDDDGEYRILRLPPGSYHVMATTKETWTVVQNGVESVLGYLPTYFPGVAAAADARRVSVGVGEQIRAVDFSLMAGRAAKVSGTAVDSQGRPFTRVSLSEEVRGLSGASFRGGPTVTVAGDGSFVARDVPPGDYTLTATRTGPTEGQPEVALMYLTVDGQDLDNIMLTGSTGGTVTGKVISEDGTLPKVSTMYVRVYEQYRSQPPPVLLGTFRTGEQGGVKEDGTFIEEHVFGRARVSVTLPDGWMLKKVQHEGRDITDKVIELRSGERLSGLEVLITNRVTDLSGHITDAKGAPVGEATLLVYPADADSWFEHSRSIRLTRPDQQGRWQLKALPAGDYLAVALEYIEDVAWQDPDFLESIRRYAEKVTIQDGGTHTLPLKLTIPKQ